MTDLEQAVAISGGIFALVMAAQYGRRDYTWHKKVMPLVSVAIFGYFYLRDAPTASVDFAVYGVGALIGLAFAIWATAVTGIERDRTTDVVHTRCGYGFVLAWLTAVLLRVVFIVSVEHVGSVRIAFGTFMMEHRITVDAIPPFFVIMAIVMVAGRVAMVQARVGSLAAQQQGVPVTHASVRTAEATS